MRRNKRSKRQKLEEITSLSSAIKALQRDFDLLELMTGAFIASMCLIGKDTFPWLFAQARDTVLCAVTFEIFGTLVLALFADHAMLSVQRVRRIAWLSFGVVLAFISGALFTLVLLQPGLMVAGAWLLKTRLQCPASLEKYSREHCYVICSVAQTAWLCMLLAFVLTILLTSIVGTNAVGESAAWVYAFVWGGFYLMLAIIMPGVRRRATLSPRLV